MKEETLKGQKLQGGQATETSQLDPPTWSLAPCGQNGDPKYMGSGIWSKDGLPASILNFLVSSLSPFPRP